MRQRQASQFCSRMTGVQCSSDSLKGIRMIEFFSGIGGFRLGVERAMARMQAAHAQQEGINQNSSSSVACDDDDRQCRYRLGACHAYEISLYANDTYKHNFHNSKDKRNNNNHINTCNDANYTVTTKLIEQLPTSTIAALHANLWTMSPPCQPFTSTTNAKRLDARDPRTAGFRSIMMLLDDLSAEQKPQWIVLENVKGFVGSDMLEEFYDCLVRNGYGWQEYLLSPMQLGIPNHRKRYYLVAEKDTCSARFGYQRGGDSIRDSLPCMEDEKEIRKRPLLQYIDQSMTEEKSAKFMVPDEILAKPWAKSLPIVSANDTMSHCFTAAYGRVVHRATGALLLTDFDHPSVEQQPELIDRSDMAKLSGKLRKFTPKELLRIFGYRHGFDFPDNISLEHQYKLIGNSVNVEVISKVMEVLFSG